MDLDEIRRRAEEKRKRRVPELAVKAMTRLVGQPGREWSYNELMKSFCDSATRTEYGVEVWSIILATPGVSQGPEVVRGGRRMRLVRWDAP